MITKPSDEEVKAAAQVLQKLEPGFLPFPIFHEVARLTTTPIVEIVPLRTHQGRTEILLLKREADDPVWPGKLHAPGTVLRATDTLQSALKRVCDDELQGVQVTEPKFVTNILHHSGRGMEAPQIYWVEVLGDASGVGQFYDADDLPEDLVRSQLDFIPQAVRAYQAR
ncbi:MAG TPA: hypothetical protein VLG11_00685 [Candidatus Saccharimonadales bacterium]|nr:hypothetical protein [Candidatus Saccharimonadales bacterium]